MTHSKAAVRRTSQADCREPTNLAGSRDVIERGAEAVARVVPPELVRASVQLVLEGMRLAGMAETESLELESRKRSVERTLAQ
ncbi:MAG: hypothetical protein DIU78_001610 [Pseudomonadota bacterium]|nr:MAG: hypothetical protein DIU78_20565 [Pseudomonadota bacterium]